MKHSCGALDRNDQIPAIDPASRDVPKPEIEPFPGIHKDGDSARLVECWTLKQTLLEEVGATPRIQGS